MKVTEKVPTDKDGAIVLDEGHVNGGILDQEGEIPEAVRKAVDKRRAKRGPVEPEWDG